MSVRRRFRLLALVTALCTGVAGLPACAPDGGGGRAGPTATCAELAEQYGSFPAGTTVTVATSFTGVEAERFNASVADFSRCTGVTIVQNGSDELENQLRAELGGSATDLADIAVVPQSGLVTDLARHGRIVPLPEAVGANTELGWDRIWSDAGRVDGELYGAPLMASLKSFIWYSPVAFERAGYEVPTTWDELVELTDRVAADHPDGSVAPWCLGAADGATTGWPVSDWLEDGLLAIHGTGAYDQWASHDVPVDAPVAVSTLDSLDSLLLAKGHVAGGRAGAVSMTMEEAGAELVSGACLMLHASSSFETVLPPGTTVTDADGAHGVTVSASPTEAASAPGGQPTSDGQPGDGGQPPSDGQPTSDGQPGDGGQPPSEGDSFGGGGGGGAYGRACEPRHCHGHLGAHWRFRVRLPPAGGRDRQHLQPGAGGRRLPRGPQGLRRRDGRHVLPHQPRVGADAAVPGRGGERQPRCGRGGGELAGRAGGLADPAVAPVGRADRRLGHDALRRRHAGHVGGADEVGPG